MSTVPVQNSNSNVSQDGNCGANSDSSATCLGSTFGDCCSEKGYCGSTDAYCAVGCQLSFGECNDASEQTVSNTGSCGATLTSNVTCLGSTWGDCCSEKGYCGGNASYCGTGCQAMFGSCGLDATTTAATVTSTSTSSSTSSSASSSSSSTSATSSPASSATPTSDPEGSGGDGGLSKGAIAGISVGSAVGGLAIIALLVWLLFFRRKKASGSDDTADLVKQPVPVYGEMPGQGMHEMDGGRKPTYEMEARAPNRAPVELHG
ncbi:uncharacterized protein DSM5745_06915 [Aspergillus mulundensis]|uniref:Chitin-binding type-1 domain-containing protein n=1 Tax=Aspergillus mulundensis TaxID=1810919 RepID=A0A3D8RJM6_9EURO|nr:Uncharacterized protein DSM5745_06915 [Aspergillus mulundensis]RDW74253.1 Uncharacterized protein DSM5745_06915 [Aspergillus mulundensis]